jgi:DNA-binding beta-propeller fold protein YncE
MKIELGYTPTGIAINPSSGYIITSDNYQHQLSIYDSNGNILSKIGFQGKENGKFNLACGIAVSNRGLIYVADYRNNRVQILTNTGEFITQITNKEDNIFSPDGIAVINNGNVIVADGYSSHVYIFQPGY